MKDNCRVADELRDFEEGRLDPNQFPHREHVRLAFEMLGCHPFHEALARFAKGLHQLAKKAGKPELYHETITAAFLALIGERRLAQSWSGWDEFAAQNQDLLNKDLLRLWYEPEILNSVIARRTFVLPKLAMRTG